MPENGYFKEKYSDLLEGQEDPDFDRLIEDLAALSAGHAPAPGVVRSVRITLQQRASQMSAGSTPAETGRKRQRLWVTPALILAVFILIGAAYAEVPIIEQAFKMDSGTARIVTDNLGTVVNRSQTIDGFTLTVKRIYADPNQVVVGYTVNGPPGQKFNTFMVWGEQAGTLPTLTDARGAQLSVAGDLYGTAVEGGKYAQVLRYTAPNQLGHATRATLAFDVGMITAVKQIGGRQLRSVAVRGRLHFVLLVPVAPGRVTYVGQSTTAAGIRVTLERVVTSLLGTRVTLRGVGPRTTADLEVNGSDYPLSSLDTYLGHRAATGTMEYLSPANLMSKHGSWMLIVKSTKDNTPRVWTFRFMMS